MAPFDEVCRGWLAERERLGLRRTLRATGTAPGLLDFSSNDYLGLARHPALIAAACAAAARHGTGGRASRLVTGTLDMHLALEARVAALKGTEAALVLASGWQANAAVLPALFRLTPDPLVFSDALIHASLIHGIRTAGLRAVRFPHNDMAALAALLAAHAGHTGQRFIVTETVFSMDGDGPDLARLRALARAHDAFLYLDDAHATGVLGPDGAGLAAGADLAMGTFSKALGGFGAFVAGSRAVIDTLTQACSGFVYTTALPPPVVAANLAALDMLPALEGARARLATDAARLRAGLVALEIGTGGAGTPIVPAIVGGAAAAMALAGALERLGILAVPIRPPTVPAGTARLRLALNAAHPADAVEQLLAALAAAWPRARAA